MKKNIQGTVKFQNLGMGFWGIIGRNGREFRPVNMPEQLKKEGATVRVIVEEISDDVSIEMWGTAVRIVSFQTITP